MTDPHPQRRNSSQRVRELEAKDKRRSEEQQLVAEATRDVVLGEIGKLVDVSRARESLHIDEDNTAVKNLADITGRAIAPGSAPPASAHESGTRPALAAALAALPDLSLPDPFPYKPDTEPSPPPSMPPPSPREGPITVRPQALDTLPRVERVIVVDDNSDIAEMISHVLKDEGYAVRTAEDGVAALNKILRDKPPPDVIILDIGLPHLSGHGVVAALQTTHLADVPVLLISASTPTSLSPSARKDYVFIMKSAALTEDLKEAMRTVVRERVAEYRARLK